MARSKALGTHRTAQVSTMLRPDDKGRVQKMAAETGVEVSEFVRNLLLAEVQKWERRKAR